MTKRISLLIVTMLFAVCMNSMAENIMADSKTLTIDYPIRGVNKNESLDFYQAVLSDTALTIIGSMYNTPNYWVRIDSNTVMLGLSTGKEYRILSAEGITLSKREYMLENGSRDFKLHFEPIDPKDKYVRFEERVKNGFVIDSICVSKEEEQTPKYRCKLSGYVDSPTCSRLALYLFDTNPRMHPFISIPVRDGYFEYELETSHRAFYNLTSWNDFSRYGACHQVLFLADNEEIHVKGASDNSNEMRIVKFKIESADSITQAIQDLRNSIFDMSDALYSERDSLDSLKLFYTPEAYILIDSLGALTSGQEELANQLRTRLTKMRENGTMFAPAAIDWERRLKEVESIAKERKMQFLSQRNDFGGLYMLYDLLDSKIYAGENTDTLINILHSQYEPTLAKEPEYQRLAFLISGYLTKPGMPCPDFTAPDLAGNNHTLSEEIKGKIAVVDLWASWCGPCRKHSKELIPIYERYKDKGFTVVGLANERYNTQAMQSAIKKDGYPWLNMYELNSRNKIFQKYGLGNAGGSVFLVDKKGIIVAVNPSAEEVEKYIEQNISK